MNQPTELLLVEDDPRDIELTLRVFREHKLTNHVIVARDGEEAVRILLPDDPSVPAPHPRFVLLDLKLPKLNGLEVLRRIRGDPRTRALPVVILTSSRIAPDLKDAYEVGVNSYLCKPVEFDAFVTVVKNLGLYWLLLNEAPVAP